MKRIYILIILIGLSLISWCYSNKWNTNPNNEKIQATIETTFEEKLYNRIEFYPNIKSQITQYQNFKKLWYKCEKQDLNWFWDYSCYNITGYQWTYSIPKWSLKLEENNGCIFAESFVLKSKRIPAFYLIWDRVYSRQINQNIENRENYIYTWEKLYVNSNEEYIQYWLNKWLNYQENIKYYIQYMSWYSYNLIDCKYLEENIININDSWNVCYQIEWEYLYFIFNKNYNFHYIYNIYWAWAPCISWVFNKIELFTN